MAIPAAAIAQIIATLAQTGLSIGAGVSAANIEQGRYNNDQAWNQFNAGLAKSNLALQQEQFAYQKAYDEWARNMSERNFELQSHPISSLLKDGSSVGVGPLAALGQNVGTASVASSSVNGSSPISGVNGALDTGLSSVLGMISSALTAKLESNTQKEIARENNNLRRQELAIIKDKNEKDYEVSKEQNALTATRDSQTYEVGKSNAKSNRVLADVARGNLDQRKIEFLHEKTRDIKQYLLEKFQVHHAAKMAESELRFKTEKFKKEYENEVRHLNHEMERIMNQKSFQSEYVKMQYITRFGSKVIDLATTILGLPANQVDTIVTGFQP